MDEMLLAPLTMFFARQSEDSVKRDLELTCRSCGTHVCDIEPEDDLYTLVGMAVDHRCPG